MVNLRLTLFFGVFLLICNYSDSQPKKIARPYQCGFYVKTFHELEKEYNTYAVPLGCKKNEVIADIGSSNGRVPVEVSVFVDSITWYIQDIDTVCLNDKEFAKVLNYHMKLKNGPITGNFHLVAGDLKKTNLPGCTFDRVLLINVFHELRYRREILEDIHRILKTSGALIVMERMAYKNGELHGDCKLPKLFEPDFLAEMKGYHYNLENKEIGEEISNLIFYSFKMIDIKD